MAQEGRVSAHSIDGARVEFKINKKVFLIYNYYYCSSAHRQYTWKRLRNICGNMVLMHEEEGWLLKCQMDVASVEKCQCHWCIVQCDGNTEDNVKPYTQDSKENSQMLDSQMDDSWDETGRHQSCMSETDGNVEHVIKPCNISTWTHHHVISIMRLKSENERLKSSVICRSCKVHQVETLNLPCCHIVFCESCADAATYCVLCEERILGTVRIYMA